MRNSIRQVASAVPWIVTFGAVVIGCGGGGASDEIPAGTCRRAAVATTGPGDTQHYFPAEVGRSWSYRLESTGATATTIVSGTQPVGSETASVFTTTTSTSATPETELVVKRGGGVYVVSGGPTEAPFDQLYPAMILPLPVAVTPPTEQARCRALSLGDLDGDAKPELADLVVSLRVFSVTETADTQAGHWSDVANVQLLATVTATSSATGQTVQVSAAEQDWYGQDVGRIVSLMTLTSPQGSESSTASLVSWSGAPVAVRAAAPALRTSADPVERAALDLATRALGRR